MEVKLQLWTNWRDLSPDELNQALAPIPTTQPSNFVVVTGWTADSTQITADSTTSTADET